MERERAECRCKRCVRGRASRNPPVRVLHSGQAAGGWARLSSACAPAGRGWTHHTWKQKMKVTKKSRMSGTRLPWSLPMMYPISTSEGC